MLTPALKALWHGKADDCDALPEGAPGTATSPITPGSPGSDPAAFEERAAILEYEAGFPREEAERRAAAMIGQRGN